MKTNEGGGGIAPPFLTSALDGGGWSASSPNSFIPEEGTVNSTNKIGNKQDTNSEHKVIFLTPFCLGQAVFLNY
jgi:hypothetical protein